MLLHELVTGDSPNVRRSVFRDPRCDFLCHFWTLITQLHHSCPRFAFYGNRSGWMRMTASWKEHDLPGVLALGCLLLSDAAEDKLHTEAALLHGRGRAAC